MQHSRRRKIASITEMSVVKRNRKFFKKERRNCRSPMQTEIRKQRDTVFPETWGLRNNSRFECKSRIPLNAIVVRLLTILSLILVRQIIDF